MSEYSIGDSVRIIHHGNKPNEIHDKKHFAIGSIHVVKGEYEVHPYPGVYLLDADKDLYFIHCDEIEKV